MKKLVVLILVCSGFLVKAQNQVCAGSSTTLSALFPASLSGQSYSMNPGGFASPNGSFVVSPTVTTSYTIVTTGQTTASTQGTVSVVRTVTVFAQPSFVPSYTMPTCTSTLSAVNLGLTFSPSGPIPSYTMAWQIFPPQTVPNVPAGITTPTQYSATGVSPSPYGALVTSVGGCTAFISFTMTPPPPPASFAIVPGGNVFSITCNVSNITFNTDNAALDYTWTANSLGQVNSPTINLTAANIGSITVVATNTLSGCVASKTINLYSNTVTPVGSISPTFQSINCNLSSIQTVTVTATSPTVNVTHIITPPQGGVFTANTYSAAYAPQGGTGIYTYSLVNDANGCSVTKNFTVTSTQGYPTFSVQSSAGSFTLGCSTTSLLTLNILGANTSSPAGGPVSYTLLNPGGSTVTPPSGSLTGPSSYSVINPGTYTVVVRDNISLCESRIPVSVTQNLLGPKLDSVSKARNILDCDNSSVRLFAHTEVAADYNWSIPGPTVTNLQSPSYTVVANTTVAASSTVAGVYTITLTEPVSKCITTSVVTIYQNLFKPTIVIASTSSILTCNTSSLLLTNQSISGITGTFFPKSLPVVGYYWEAPSPQQPLSASSTFTALGPGIYTLTGKDLNNGCLASSTRTITDGFIYPDVRLRSTTVTPAPQSPTSTPIIDCGALGYTFTAETFPPVGASYIWTSPTTTNQGVATNSVFLATTIGSYTVVVTNTANGCSTSFITPAVTIGSLTGVIDADKKFGYAPLTVNFSNNSYSGINSTSNIQPVWNFGNGKATPTVVAVKDATLAQYATPSIIYTHPGNYIVTAFLTKGLCQATATTAIQVELPSKLIVPNVFTPNGDKVNDVFILHTANVSEITVKIYDRWGTKVYELVSSTGNVEWDGMNQYGIECPQGSYFYNIKATGKDGQTWDEKGTISLFR